MAHIQLVLLLACILCHAVGMAQPPEPCGMRIPEPNISVSARLQMQQQLAEAKSALDQNPSNPDAIVWYGRRQAYLGQYREAIETFSAGIQMHPQNAALYRHRGHRYLTIRCFDKAMADFEKAAALTKGKPDEPEPDGMPNAQNIPVSSLQTNIYYHLGLAHYLKGDLYLAQPAFETCLALCTNNDMYVATANWLYITLRQLKKNKEASALLATVDPRKPLIENKVYLDLLCLYKNKAPFTLPPAATSSNTQYATWLYGFLVYCKINGQKEMAGKAKQQLLASGQWASFGFIAAETEGNRPF